MKRLFQWIFAATLICGLNVFSSCSSDNNHARPSYNLAEKIIGKWMVADRNGQPMLTNEKKVYTFVSATKAYVSASLNSNPEKGSIWDVETEVDVAIIGNKITVTTHPFEQTTVVEDYTITAINGSEFTANTMMKKVMNYIR